MNISLVFLIEGQVSSENILDAYHLTRLVHPYLRMRIAQIGDDQPVPWYVEDPEQPIQLETEKATLNDNTWQHGLEQNANTARDHGMSLTYMKLLSDEGGDHHQLFFVINHGGIDGIGIFAFACTFLEFLGQVSAGEEIPDPKSLEFIDILSQIPPDADKILPPSIPEQYIPPLKSDVEDPNQLACILGTWFELDEEATETLVKNCRTRSATIQGALNAAVMLALVRVQVVTYPLPQTIVMMAPVNMRSYVDPPVGNEHCVCGSAGLIWAQEISPEESIWDVVRLSNEKMEENLEARSPLGWWAGIEKMQPQPIPTVMMSSIGKVPVAVNYGALRVTGVKLLGGAYDNSRAAAAGIMTHAYTVLGRLNVTFAFTSPPWSRELAKNFTGIERAVFSALSTDARGDIQVGDFLKSFNE